MTIAKCGSCSCCYRCNCLLFDQNVCIERVIAVRGTENAAEGRTDDDEIMNEDDGGHL